MNKPGKKKGKSIPYLSHEYVIKNHGDIVSFVATIFILGFMFKLTQPICSLFIVMQRHNASANASDANSNIVYKPGGCDFLAIFFYSLFCVVFHAAFQEYGLDKLNKKFHLSKTKYSKFNQSGQLLIFYVISFCWIIKLIQDEKLYTDGLNVLWQDYPHHLTFWIKVFYIIQLSYWVHEFPELYFQKIKNEDFKSRMSYPALYIIMIGLAYFLNLNRLGLLLLGLHYSVEILFHVSRLLYLAALPKFSRLSFPIWKLMFVLVRIASVFVAFLVFFRGLPKFGLSKVDIKEGNFNTPVFRFNCMALVCLVQVYMAWAFITFHMRRYRDQKLAKIQEAKFTTNSDLYKRTKKPKSRMDDDINELPEADQQHELRMRKKAK